MVARFRFTMGSQSLELRRQILAERERDKIPKTQRERRCRNTFQVATLNGNETAVDERRSDDLES